MSAISNCLPITKVDLALKASTRTEAVDNVLARLAGDPDVRNFEELRKTIQRSEAPVLCENEAGLLIAHARTESVGRLVLAVGRFAEPLALPDTECPLRLVFVAGIPAAFNSEYLRVVGAIVRIFKSPSDLANLLDCTTPPEFLKFLSAAENRL